MSIYYELLPTIEPRLAKLTRQQLVALLAPCVQYAFASNYPRFAAAIDPAQLAQAFQALDVLLGARLRPVPAETIRATAAALDAIMPDDDSPAVVVSGWQHALIATRHALETLLADDVASEAVLALDASYQSIAENELKHAMTVGAGSLAGDEITQAERDSSQCLATVAYHLTCLQNVEEGRDIPLAPLPDLEAVRRQIAAAEERLAQLCEQLEPAAFQEMVRKFPLAAGPDTAALTDGQRIRRAGELENLIEWARQQIACTRIRRIESTLLDGTP